MSNIVKLPPPPPSPPIVKKHKQVVSVQEMFAQGEDMPEAMVWDMCRYTKSPRPDEDNPCKECPRWEEDPNYGKVQRGCFGMAQEACRYAMAWIERMNHGGPYD
jgi:hypothetical protein